MQSSSFGLQSDGTFQGRAMPLPRSGPFSDEGAQHFERNSPIPLANLFFDSLSRRSGNGRILPHRSLMQCIHRFYSNRVPVPLPQRLVIRSPLALVSWIVAL